jgi:hypothetical protein
MTKKLIRNPSGVIEMALAPTKPGRKPKHQIVENVKLARLAKISRYHGAWWACGRGGKSYYRGLDLHGEHADTDVAAKNQ